jgi:hypothetical protein
LQRSTSHKSQVRDVRSYHIQWARTRRYAASSAPAYLPATQQTRGIQTFVIRNQAILHVDSANHATDGQVASQHVLEIRKLQDRRFLFLGLTPSGQSALRGLEGFGCHAESRADDLWAPKTFNTHGKGGENTGRTIRAPSRLGTRVETGENRLGNANKKAPP